MSPADSTAHWYTDETQRRTYTPRLFISINLLIPIYDDHK